MDILVNNCSNTSSNLDKVAGIDVESDKKKRQNPTGYDKLRWIHIDLP